MRAWADIGATRRHPGRLPSVDDTRFATMGTVRGRVGYAFDQVLLYGTGRLRLGRDNRLPASLRGVSVSDSHIPLRLDCRRRRRSHVRTEMVGQGRVPLSQLQQARPTTSQASSQAALRCGTINLNSVQVGVNYHF